MNLLPIFVFILLSFQAAASDDCASLQSDSRFLDLKQFIQETSELETWPDFKFGSNPIYASFIPFNRCTIAFISGIKTETIYSSAPFIVDDDATDNYERTWYRFELNEDYTSFFPPELASHIAFAGKKSLGLVYSQNYFQKTKLLRTAIHEGFHHFSQEFSRPNPSMYRESIDNVCYAGFSKAEGDLLLETLQLLTKGSKLQAKKIFLKYKNVRSSRNRDLYFTDQFDRKWTCSESEDIMEKMEGIPEFVSWKTMISIKRYNYSISEMIVTIKTSFSNEEWGKKEVYYNSGAILLSILSINSPKAILENSYTWTKSEKDWGISIIKAVENSFN